MSRKQHQTGSVTVIVLIIAVLVLCGAVGWLLYDRNSNTALQSTTNDAKTIVQNSASSYLEISDWNVKMPLTKQYADATYTFDEYGYAEISSKSVGGGEVASIVRYKLGDTVVSPDGDPAKQQTFDEDYLKDNSDLYTKVDDYYYEVIGSQASITQARQAFEDYIKKAINSLEAI